MYHKYKSYFFPICTINRFHIILKTHHIRLLIWSHMGNENVCIFIIWQACNAFIIAIKILPSCMKLDPVNPLLQNARNIMYNVQQCNKNILLFPYFCVFCDKIEVIGKITRLVEMKLYIDTFQQKYLAGPPLNF